MKKGIVIKTTGSNYIVRDEQGNQENCYIKGKFKISGIKSTNPIAVGDRVEYIPESETSQGLIYKIEPRKNYIIRKSAKLSKQTHIIASNLDQALLIITCVLPRTSTGFIDRFLLTCNAYEIPCIIVFNKIDLYEEETKEYANYLKSIYEPLGYKCIDTSAITKEGIDNLKAQMQGKINLLSGHSGVGKSALVNALQPGLDLKTSEISLSNLKGKHTTTFAQMYHLDFGADIIDTPGIRSFGMVDFKKEEVALYFPEMKRLLSECRFYNCTHIHEPGCAIKQAVEDGEISSERYANYISIINTEEVQQEEWKTR